MVAQRAAVFSWLLTTVFWSLPPGVPAAAEPPESLRADISPCHDCNVVFVSFDTLRADYAQRRTHGRPLMPTLEQLAERGIVFTQAVSSSSWTLPATMSWFTGVSPSRHRVTNKYSVAEAEGRSEEGLTLQTLAPEFMTMAEAFRSRRYRTGGFTGGAAVHRQFGFDRGFEVYVDDVNFGGFRHTVPVALDWIRTHRDEKLFLFLHGYDCHGQYEPDGGLDYRDVPRGYQGAHTGSAAEQRQLREEGLEKGQLFLTDRDVEFWKGVYAEKVERADQEFRTFLEAYRQLGLMGKTVFVITSDHGEELMEHGRLDHGPTLYEEVVRVPLIVVIPGLRKSLRVSRQVRAIDVMPTILWLAGIEAPEPLAHQMQGTNALEAGSVPADARIETEYRYATFLDALREPSLPHWKLIVNRETHAQELFNLSRDAQERRDLHKTDSAVARRLQQRLLTQ